MYESRSEIGWFLMWEGIETELIVVRRVRRGGRIGAAAEAGVVVVGASANLIVGFWVSAFGRQWVLALPPRTGRGREEGETGAKRNEENGSERTR